MAADDVSGLTRMLGELRIEINTSPSAGRAGPLVSIDGGDMRREAQDPAIATELSGISGIPEVRRLLIRPQRRSAQGNAVILGRDIGTVIFPDADAKFFFTAPAAERVARRRRELDQARGSATPDSVLEQEIDARDRADQEREIAPLRPATDAIIVATEGKSVGQAFDEVMAPLPHHSP